MAKIKTITTVKPHYIGEKSLSEAFSSILKRQIEQGILQHDNLIYDTSLKDNGNCAKIDTSNLLSESEEL
ncbi:MAG: hypothetical protein ACRCW1_01225 [Anaerotignaceae bacterium]